MNDALWLALSKINGLGVKKLISLYEYNSEFSLYDLASRSHYMELKNIVKSNEIVETFQDISYMQGLVHSAEKQIEAHKQKGIEVIPYINEKYPDLLRFIPDPPIALFCKGNIGALKNTENIAVIGTRNPTEVGLKVAKKVAFMFAKRGFTIVSGLALGIDTASHQGALDANGITIAVMAGGLDKIYPKENKRLAEEIILNNGLLVSEYAIGTPMQRSSFVKRDRIQSGLSIGICPVQTDVDGGTMHTVRYAHVQKRVLFCPKILEDENLPVYRGITKVIKDYNVPILESENDYEKIIDILKNNINNNLPNISSKNEQTKKLDSIKKSLKQQEVPEQVSLDSFIFSNERTQPHYLSKDNEVFKDFIIKAKQLAERNGLNKEQFIKKIDELWNGAE